MNHYHDFSFGFYQFLSFFRELGESPTKHFLKHTGCRRLSKGPAFRESTASTLGWSHCKQVNMIATYIYILYIDLSPSRLHPHGSTRSRVLSRMLATRPCQLLWLGGKAPSQDSWVTGHSRPLKMTQATWAKCWLGHQFQADLQGLTLHDLTNAKLGLIIPAVLINPLCPPKKCNLKTGGPPRLINRWAYPRLINHQCWNHFFLSNIFYFQFYLFPIVFYICFYHDCYT